MSNTCISFFRIIQITVELTDFFSYNAKVNVPQRRLIINKAVAASAAVRKKENTMLRYIVIFLISMVPLIELRGAIPYAVGTNCKMVAAYIIAIIGNMVPVPFIYFFARKVLLWGKDKRFIGRFFRFCLVKGEKGGAKLQAKAGRGLFVALMLFVGIPIPGTGAWTGTLAASILDMGFKKSVIAVMLGVIIAGVIMGLASLGIFGAIGAIFAPKA